MEGREPLEQSSVTIVGVVRNGAPHLPRSIERLRAAFGRARSLRFIIVESDSTDDTPAVLEALSRRIAGFQAVFLGALTSAFPLRTDRIAHCRNAYLNELASDGAALIDGYVVVADLDGVNDALTCEAVATCFSSATPWDVCTANQGDYYYDIWALRHASWSPDDCWALYRSLVDLVGPAQALELAVHARMVHLDARWPMIEVASAFGGLAIYRSTALKGRVYDTRAEDGSKVCEHVMMHKSLRADGYRIFINPALVNARATPHSWHRKRIARTLRALAPGLYRPDPQSTLPPARIVQLLRSLRSIAARLA